MAFAFALAACASPNTAAPASEALAHSPPAAPTTAAQSAETVALHLYISNQSFRMDPVDITVTIDGHVKVDDDFFVEGQHNWKLFTIRLTPGDHDVLAKARSGEIVLRKTLRLPARRWAVLDYWNYEDQPERLLWRVSRTQVAFD